ncbi:GntR family transcriptional regulator [Alistipes sp.]|uniref:GntR family transcriptional regulator n=1 Tax=Alistipes sp. TaxID=1872444 RepID=UPI003AF5D0AE
MAYIDPNSPEPLHKQAEEMLRELISRKEYLQGKLLPPEVALAGQLNISRNTLRQAINKLVYEGLLVRKKGYGTRVAHRSIFSGAKNWMSFSQEMKALGVKVRNFELHLSWKRPDAEVANFFSADRNESLFTLERLRGNEIYPFVYFISYFNPRIPVTGTENFSRPLYEILAKDYGVIVRTSKEEISAALADEFIAEKLRITTQDPVLIRKRFVYDANGEPVEYNIGVYKADSFVYSIECRG